MSSNKELPPQTPMDIRLGLTKPEDVAFPLRWGIIGTGNISAQWVAMLKACAGATVTAVAASTSRRAREFSETHEIESSYGNYADMVASRDVDIVYIGTVTDLHKEHSLLAIEAGKHVLCEKPLAHSVDDARIMFAAAAKKKVMLQDGMWTRYFPAVEHARCAIEAGLIGEVVMVTSDFFDPVYPIQAAPLGFGANALPTAIWVGGRKGSAAIVEYGDEKCAVLTFPQFNCELPEVTEIMGTKGRITLCQPGHCPTRISISLPSRVPSRYMTHNIPAPVQAFEYPLPGTVNIPSAYPNQHGFLYQAEAIHRCLAAELLECPQYNPEESIHTMELLTEILRARARNKLM